VPKALCAAQYPTSPSNVGLVLSHCFVLCHCRSFLPLEDSLSTSCRITADSDAREPDEDDAAAGAKLGQGLAAAHAAGSLVHLRSFCCDKELAAVPRLLMVS